MAAPSPMTTTGVQLQPAAGHSFRTIIDPSLLPPKKRPTNSASASPSPHSFRSIIDPSLLPPKKRPMNSAAASPSPTTTTGVQLQPAGHSFRSIIDPSLLPPKKRPTNSAAASPSPTMTTTTGSQLHLAAGCGLPTTTQIQESLLRPKKRPSSSTTSASSSSALLVSPMKKRRMDHYAVDARAASCSRMAAALQQVGPPAACGTMASKRARKASSRYSADLWTQ